VIVRTAAEAIKLHDPIVAMAILLDAASKRAIDQPLHFLH